MTMPMKPRRPKLRPLTLNRETLANLTAGETELAIGGKAGKKNKTKPPRTLDIICESPTFQCLTGGGICAPTCAHTCSGCP